VDVWIQAAHAYALRTSATGIAAVGTTELASAASTRRLDETDLRLE
jgi:hypothetical protein